VSQRLGRPLRILVVNWLDRENPRSGGAETHLHQVFGRLARWGHAVTALVSGFPGAEPRAALDGMDVHRTGGRHTFSLVAPRYFRRVLSGEDYDVVVEDLNKVPLFTPRWTAGPIVLLVHHLFGRTAFQAASPPVALATVLLERLIPRVYGSVPIVAVSESTREDMALRGVDPGHISVIPNGIDTAGLSPDPDGAREANPTLLFIGRLNRYKRLDLVLEALAILGRRGLRPRLWVAGRGPEADRWGRLVRALGLGEQVEFLGFVSEEEKLRLLRRSWIHVLTSSKEGWGISNLEAAACGTPTIASDAPGLRESVVHGETGLLVPHENVAALADAIDRLLSDEETRGAMGRAGRRFAQQYSWDAAAERTERLLHRVVARHGLG
jgi:glycosyltransferase involved in cell wall biosynthesis